jgi:hypothetical protein
MRASKSALISAFALFVSAACDEEQVTPTDGGGGSGAGGGAGASGGGGSGTGAGGSEPTDKWPHLGCDPLVPEFCGFPFPSNVYTVPDAATATGRRVSFLPEMHPASFNGPQATTEAWTRSDGFSSGGNAITQLPGATAAGLPTAAEVERSLDADCPSILLDVETGERILHWTEVDKTAGDPAKRGILIHPAVPLRDGARYVAALRGVRDAGGATIAPSAGFAALRDGTSSDEPSIEARRELYEEIFGALTDAGVDTGELQIAWDYTTASRANTTDWLVHMRDTAYELGGTDGPAYTITSVDSELDPANIAFRVRGTMTVPLFLTNPDPGAFLVFGGDGLPIPNPDQPTYEVEWQLLIPQSALTSPAKLLQYGHGLLGEATQIESGHFRSFCNLNNYAVFSTKLVGMASEDENFIGDKVSAGELDELTSMFDRLHQGFVNNLMVMRMMSRGMDTDATYGNYLDGSRRFYWGISQGGISGGVLMALSEDVERGTLEVMGQPYAVLLNRSVDFDPFFALMAFQYPDPRSRLLLLDMLQMLWDRVEPAGYTKYTFDEPFAGSPADRRLLLRVAIGDHQVTTFAGHTMARAMGAKHLDTGLRDVFGLESVTGPVDAPGAVYAEWDFGLPPEPACNLPLRTCEDPHGELRKLDDARAQIHQFFDTGVIANTCVAGLCSHPELSGCTGNEDQDPCDDSP